MKKLLLAVYEEIFTKPARKNSVSGPHVLTPEHVKKIRAVSKELEIIVTAHKKDAQKNSADAEIIAGFPSTIPPLSEAKNLKWVHSFSAGMDRVLTSELVKSSVICSNSSGIHQTPIAEHVIAFLLIFTRGFLKTLSNQQKRLWRKDDTVTELCGKTVLIVGLGNIGGEVARLVHAFGAKVIAVSRSQKEQIEEIYEMKKPSALDAVLPRADFIVNCLPYTNETYHLFDLTRFQRMKRSAVFINIARGGIVHEKDLIVALKKKIIAGAGLDVTEIEPLPKASPLWCMPNVIITPHHSGLSEQYMNRAIDRFCLNLKAYLAGERLPNLVDKKRGY
ncbi:MAG: D-2-hydroxyacid dehydrogenase [Candidatus Sungbacteria bacterium]|nr:D-2-hydroxyacid dehydrogenase [Candidatus Sungbacteria bacterium]